MVVHDLQWLRFLLDPHRQFSSTRANTIYHQSIRNNAVQHQQDTVHTMHACGQSMAANQEDLSTDSHERKSHHRYRAAGTRKRLSSKFLPCSTRNTLDRCQICCAITPALAFASWCQRRETTGISVLPDSINPYPLACQGSHCLPATRL